MFLPKAVFFDLDGTLLDTAPDLAAALNYLRQQHQLAPLPLNEIRPVCSDGAKGLIEHGLGITDTDKTFPQLRHQLLDYYAMHIADHTQLFDGFHKIFALLAAHQIPWGIVTNKPHDLTQPLLEKLALTQYTACIVSGDTLLQRKPHPAPLLHAAAQLNCAPENCCYVGDALRDIQAAQQANMFSVVALYGYIHLQENPYQWQANAYIKNPEDLLTLFELKGA